LILISTGITVLTSGRGSLRAEATVEPGSSTQRYIPFCNALVPLCYVRCHSLLNYADVNFILIIPFSSQDWISSHHASPDSLPPPSTSNPNASGSSSSANSNNPHSRFVSTSNPIVNGGLTPSQRAALTRKFVIRPSDPEKAARPCAICREGFEGEFREDEEEWVWGNAVVGADGNVSSLLILPFLG
jgi:hypothetical protein